MADYHTVYKGPEGETTQWEDIHRKLGNLPPKPPAWKPDPYKPEEEAAAKDVAWVDSKKEEELSDLEEELVDDRFLEEYRQQRLRELRAAATRPRFGTLDEISGNQFVQVVTDGSRDHWVVCLLYKTGNPGCEVVGSCLEQLARSYPAVHFVKIVSTSCIPGYPDANLPTLLVYHSGAAARTLVGLAQLGGQRTTPEALALALNAVGPVCCREGEDEEAAAERQVRGLVQRLVLRREKGARGEGDESSDFDD